MRLGFLEKGLPIGRENGDLGCTVAKFFQSSLQDLVQMIDLTNPHWIRCIKPHSSNRPRMFWYACAFLPGT